MERSRSPGPGEYVLPDTFQQPQPGGQFSTGRREIDLHWDTKAGPSFRPRAGVAPMIGFGAGSRALGAKSTGTPSCVLSDILRPR